MDAEYQSKEEIMTGKKPSLTGVTKNELAAAIREEIQRFEQSLLGHLKPPVKGCDAGDYGCCECEPTHHDYREIDEMIQHRPDVLQQYIESNKEPIRKFFEKNGIKLTK